MENNPNPVCVSDEGTTARFLIICAHAGLSSCQAEAVRLLLEDKHTLTCVISSGTAEHPTPTGRFKVLRKEKNKVSHSYTNALNMPTPMPYSMQFQGPYFIHEGWVPGYPDSHGCVRLHYEDARFLFKRMRRGDKILIGGSGGYKNWVREIPDDPWVRELPDNSWLRETTYNPWLQEIQGSWIAPQDPRRR